MLPGDAQHERAQRLGEHVHLIELELYHLLLEQPPAALCPCARQRQRHAAGIVTDAERIGGKLEVAEQIAPVRSPA